MQTPVTPELLAKYAAGQCTPAEKALVEQWGQASPDNERQLRNFEQVWSVSQADDPEEVPDTDASWNQLRGRLEKIRPLTVKEETREPSWYASWWRVAAVVLLGLGLGWGVYRFTSRGVSQPVLAEQVTGNNQVAVTLSDGSQIRLNRNSRLRYPKQFTGQATREVYLEGEAYFEVARNPEQPFLIHAQQSVTKVLGTAFNVQAYYQDSTITVSVSSGKVAFYEAEKEKEGTVLLPQQEAALVKASGKITKRPVRDENYRSWQTGRITFRNTPLPAVVQTLNRHYGAKITITNPALTRCKLTADFDNQSLTEALEVIRLTLNIGYEKRDSQILLTGKGC